MGELKRVVVDDYPAASLPDEVRGAIDPSQKVRVTVEETPDDPWRSLREKIDHYHRDNPKAGTTGEDAVGRVRALRDEWD